MEILRWVFIVIGFLGALCTIVISSINLHRTITKKTIHTYILIQIVLIVSNIMMFTYALGLSMINLNSPIFYNSMPTWVGNGIALVINVIITILIRKKV